MELISDGSISNHITKKIYQFSFEFFLPKLFPNNSKDYQEIFCCEVILIDDNKNHCEIEIHDTGEIEMLQQGYLPSGELFHISFDPITTFPQFIALIQRTENSSD